MLQLSFKFQSILYAFEQKDSALVNSYIKEMLDFITENVRYTSDYTLNNKMAIRIVYLNMGEYRIHIQLDKNKDIIGFEVKFLLVDYSLCKLSDEESTFNFNSIITSDGDYIEPINRLPINFVLGLYSFCCSSVNTFFVYDGIKSWYPVSVV